ncbi:MAG: hypothetical protein A6F72_01525 [Cycloclasticus sp. symbiont of Poecilosclerida sp. N]|nr:MAG: hypothetical protein A6F72_01525 [Cycloclasticus sp. symbiont of Poecilosclerida sp. N]
MILASFLAFLAIILFVGLYSKRFSKQTTDDYLIASGNIPVWQTVLSALASAYSGFMYIGLIGYTYTQGVSGIWLMVFWIFGEFCVFIYLPKKVSQVSQRRNLNSYNALLANYWGQNHTLVKKSAAIITLIFLSIYAAAQFNAAGKALQSTLLWSPIIGSVFTYFVVLAYSYVGGIRASIWTDNIQFVIMVVSIAILVWLSLDAIGGWSMFVDKLHNNPVAYTQWFPESMGSLFFIILFLLGWVGGGFGIAGQPHIVVRFMAMKKTRKYKQILFGYYALAVIFTGLCLLSALLAKVYFAGTLAADFDTETTLPTLATAVLPAMLVGLMLSAILSAIISTADSQILSCSAALGTDLLKPKATDKESLRQNKFSTALVATFALLIALYGGESVFTLVILAWSGLASAFMPLLVIQLMGHKPSQTLSITIMLSGLLAAIIWRMTGLNSLTYEAIIGIAVGFIVFYVVKILSPADKAKE